MKLAEKPRTLETIGVEEEVDVTIKASGKAFRMLISGLYSDIALAIVREIAANAADSHIVAGTTQPFFVHCPNDIRPEFFVRDYGEGMDHRKVMDIYSVLFESDKEDSNDVTGAFGLGKATPLAYSDQFSISCYDGAEVRHYGCVIRPDGKPKIMLMGREACDEPRGVRVTLAVEEKDFSSFRHAIAKVGMAHVPAFESNVPLNKLGTADYAGEGYTAYVDSDLSNNWSVRQGCVIYPLDSGSINLPADHFRGSGRNRRWLIEAEMGSISITGSREAVQYSDEAKAYLKEKIEALKLDVGRQAWDRVKDITDLVDFHKAWEQARVGFLEEKMAHPLTGYKGTTVFMQTGSLVLETKIDDYRKRWVFKTTTSMDAANYREPVAPVKDGEEIIKKGEPRKGVSEMFWLDDVTPLLDPTRETSLTEFSKSEARRVSRLTRAYLEKKKLTSGFFLLGPQLDDEKWQACFPSVKRIKITYEELRDAAPKRLQPLLGEDDLPPIRGLGVAAKAGDQQPVSRVVFQEGDAWIEADNYRKKPSDLFAFAKRFGITRLYLASPTVESVVKEAGVPHIRDAMDAFLKTHGVSWAELQHMREGLTTDSAMGPFCAKLQAKQPDLYDAFERTKGTFGKLAKLQRPFHVCGFNELTDAETKVMKQIDTPVGGYSETIHPRSKRVEEFLKLSKRSNEAYYHPTYAFLGRLSHCKTRDQMVAAIAMLAAFEKHMPLTMKFTHS